jgi:hypothetical protein
MTQESMQQLSSLANTISQSRRLKFSQSLSKSINFWFSLWLTGWLETFVNWMPWRQSAIRIRIPPRYDDPIWIWANSIFSVTGNSSFCVRWIAG